MYAWGTSPTLSPTDLPCVQHGARRQRRRGHPSPPACKRRTSGAHQVRCGAKLGPGLGCRACVRSTLPQRGASASTPRQQQICTMHVYLSAAGCPTLPARHAHPNWQRPACQLLRCRSQAPHMSVTCAPRCPPPTAHHDPPTMTRQLHQRSSLLAERSLPLCASGFAPAACACPACLSAAADPAHPPSTLPFPLLQPMPVPAWTAPSRQAAWWRVIACSRVDLPSIPHRLQQLGAWVEARLQLPPCYRWLPLTSTRLFSPAPTCSVARPSWCAGGGLLDWRGARRAGAVLRTVGGPPGGPACRLSRRTAVQAQQASWQRCAPFVLAWAQFFPLPRSCMVDGGRRGLAPHHAPNLAMAFLLGSLPLTAACFTACTASTGLLRRGRREERRPAHAAPGR